MFALRLPEQRKEEIDGKKTLRRGFGLELWMTLVTSNKAEK
jgi:hypothetical protein